MAGQVSKEKLGSVIMAKGKASGSSLHDKATLASASAGARKAKGKAPQQTSSIDADQALTYLHRACSLASLAVSHIDLAVAVFSGFLDPKKVAGLSDFTDKRAYISEDGPYPSD